MNTLFKFNSVGFGLFYSGLIMNNKSLYSFAYDCGGVKSLAKKRIIEFSANVFSLNAPISSTNVAVHKKPTLNMLVISHLHMDHISGIDEIYNNFDVEKVYLPYILSSEITYYLLYLAIINGPNSYKIYQKIDELYAKKDEEAIIIKNSNALSPIQSDWHFVFFNQHISDQDMQNYMSPINKILKNNGIESFENLIYNSDPKTITQIQQALKHCKIKDINVTSLTLMHYPENTNASLFIVNSETYLGHKNLIPNSKTDKVKQKNITLLTGDALYSPTTQNQIYSYLNNDSRKAVLQVPHHGSYKNWDSLGQNVKKDFQYYVISASYTIRYNLPDSQVLNEILEFKKYPTLVHQFQGFAYQVK